MEREWREKAGREEERGSERRGEREKGLGKKNKREAQWNKTKGLTSGRLIQQSNQKGRKGGSKRTIHQ